MKVALVTYGAFPVPASKGGAVENLLEDIIEQNEVMGNLEITVFSVYESTAVKMADEYRKTEFVFVKVPDFLDIIDRAICWGAKNIFKKGNLISYRYILKRLYVIKHYPHKLLEGDFDKVILVTNSTLFLLLKNRQINKKYLSKVVYYLHNEVRTFFGCEKYLADIYSIIGISNFVNQSLQRKIPAIHKDKYQILKNCIDTNQFLKCTQNEKYKIRKCYDIDPQDFVILYSGRLVKEKGVLETIQAFKKVNNKRIKLLIVGGSFYSSDLVDPYSKFLHNEAKSCGDKVIFTGYIPYEKMSSIYLIADIAVLPSLWNEPAGMTMVEAVISGLPLITTDSGGIPEYINSNCAFMLKRNNNLVQEIADKIELLISDPILLTQMSDAGRQLRNVYNLENYYINFVNLIDRRK